MDTPQTEDLDTPQSEDLTWHVVHSKTLKYKSLTRQMPEAFGGEPERGMGRCWPGKSARGMCVLLI